MRGSDTYDLLSYGIIQIMNLLKFILFIPDTCVSFRCELVFENCFVPQENVLGQEGKGISSADILF